MSNAHGKICYVEIPATNIEESANFYAKVFGWQIKKRGDGSTAFDDPTGGVSGTWVLGRPLAAEPGLFIYIMVASMEAIVEAIASAGGEVVHWLTPGTPEIARFRDPAGNVIGLYHHPGL
jgi:predicted enzyme related to lactoylglutathione lyase